MKILMRTNMWPEGIFSPEELLAYDRIGSNIGNMLFPYSIGRWINGVEDITIDPIRDSEVEKFEDINENYDMLLLPFANAFRKEFIPFLNRWTKLIQSLTIPCVVIGIGAQSRIDDEELSFEFDEDVKAFCDAVLEKSATIGVRGEITKKYLMKTGVPQDRIHVIGCPSMFVNGSDYIAIEKKPYEEVKNISLNSSKWISGLPVVIDWMEKLPNAIFIPQETWELVTLYMGYQSQQINNRYFVTAGHKYVQEGRVRTFIDTISWMSYLHNNIDVSGGTRIHGNVAALIAGVPALVIACDTRVKEICEYFAIPYQSVNVLREEKTSFEDWYRDIDFTAMNERYPDALKDYESFWVENKIPYKIPETRVSLMDNEDIFDIVSFWELSDSEKVEHINKYMGMSQQRWLERVKDRDETLKLVRSRYWSLRDEIELVRSRYWAENEAKNKLKDELALVRSRYWAENEAKNNFKKELASTKKQLKDRQDEVKKLKKLKNEYENISVYRFMKYVIKRDWRKLKNKIKKILKKN